MESTEWDIINMIKENAVQTINKLRHKGEFFKMDKEENENSQQYGPDGKQPPKPQRKLPRKS